MATIRNKNGETFEVSDADAAQMQAADPSLTVVGDVNVAAHEPDSVIASEDSSRALGQEGTDAASADALGHYAHRESLRGKTSAIGAGIRSGLGAATFGLTDKLFDPTTIEADREMHSTASGIGTGVGLVLPTLVGDDFGLARLAEDPLEVERAGSALSSKFLYAGEVGGEANSAGKLAERGLQRAGKTLDEAKSIVMPAPDIANLDIKGLNAAHEAEVSRLAEEQAAQRTAAKAGTVQDLAAYRQQVKEANPWLVIDEGQDASRLNKANRSIRSALDTPKALANNPGTLLKPLEAEEQALEGAIARREEIATKLDTVNTKIAKDLEMDLQTLPDAATHVELSGKAARRYASFADVKVGKDAVVQVSRDDAQSFLQALKGGEVAGDSKKALEQLPTLLEQNRALQERIKSAIAPAAAKSELTSERLAAIKSAKEALMVPAKPKSLVEDMLGGTIMGHISGALSGLPIIGPAIGAKAGRLASDFIFGRLGGATAEMAGRSKAAVASFLGMGKRLATSPVLATRVLAKTAFGPGTPDQPQPRGLAATFKARSQEIRSQTMYGPDGKPMMRPEARQAVSDRLSALRINSPVLADKLETLAARRIEFLSSKLPRRPDLPGVLSGPDRWQPSDMEMRTFARYVAAVEDPSGVEERLAAGTATPEDAEAYRAVYPERFNALQTQILQTLPQLKKTLPYQKRLSFSIFSGVPVDPSMAPNIVAALQSQFEQEPDSEGGMQSPKAQPQFGSVKKSIEEPTPAQHRAQ